MRRSARFKKYIKQWSKEILIGVGAAFIAFLLILGTYSSPIDDQSTLEIIFVIQEGESARQISENLQTRGLIKSQLLFRVYLMGTGTSRNLQAGSYLLSPGMSMVEIMQKFAQGDIVTEEITIPEGWNIQRIAAALEARGLFTEEEFSHITGDPGLDYRDHPDATQPQDFSDEFELLKEKPEYISLEGFLFPDTYKITKGETAEGLVRKMLLNFHTQVHGKLLSQIQKSERNFFEILVMASIIEKEVPLFEDKKLISGVLWKRFDEGMRLQVDSTLVYVRPINYEIVTTDDTYINSPYNTYRHEGLPLGPISSPGIESIQAALEPKESPYYFYFSASPTNTIFSKTFKEHKANRARYGI